MPTREIDELIWKALTDLDFRKRLLNGQRGEMLKTLNLTEAEQQAILAVQTDTLENLASALCPPGLPRT